MNKLYPVLFLILMMAQIPSVLGDPQIGEPPFYKYPFLFDYKFNVPGTLLLYGLTVIHHFLYSVLAIVG